MNLLSAIEKTVPLFYCAKWKCHQVSMSLLQVPGCRISEIILCRSCVRVFSKGVLVAEADSKSISSGENCKSVMGGDEHVLNFNQLS